MVFQPRVPNTFPRTYEQGIEAARRVFLGMQPQGLTLASAESCTGGLISALFTEIPGSSAVYIAGICTYAERTKVDLLGIAPEVIATHGVVSVEVALAMARRVRDLVGADIGIATTGIAGPQGATPELPVGSVCWAVAGVDAHGMVIDQGFSQHFSGSRWQVRLAIAWQVFNYLQGLA